MPLFILMQFNGVDRYVNTTHIESFELNKSYRDFETVCINLHMGYNNWHCNVMIHKQELTKLIGAR